MIIRMSFQQQGPKLSIIHPDTFVIVRMARCREKGVRMNFWLRLAMSGFANALCQA